MLAIRTASGEPVSQPRGVDDEHSLSLCSLKAGSSIFGIDTRTIKEVLSRKTILQVPLAPEFIGGIVSYRGEVLTTISLRALLGLSSSENESCVMVLEEDENGERFGLIVDGVGGVVVVDAREHIANPSTLDESSALIYDGVFRTAEGLMVLLTSKKLRPSSLDQGQFLRQSPAHGGRLHHQGDPIGTYPREIAKN